ncbi:MAG: helix-turn-helix transcriptional regulator [Actinomycetota bacterium]|nr:helix-turn-helix transcriptional regulator [Actinomycetota bacterium]
MKKKKEEDFRDIDIPVYMISVAAKLAGVHPQTLRIYERKKLIRPSRTPGSTRLYSAEDIQRLKYIQRLTQECGVNLAGVRLIMDLRRELEVMKKALNEAEKRFEDFEREVEERMENIRRSHRRDLVLIPRGEIVRR